jgi:integrating conjugative element membrane protein (TIGR03747 family)
MASQSASPKHHTRGPVELLIEVTMGLFFVTVLSCFIGFLIEIAGGYFFWPEQGISHSRALVVQDLGYIANAPRSVLIEDTVGFSYAVVEAVAWPFNRLGLVQWQARSVQPAEPLEHIAGRGFKEQLRKASQSVYQTLSSWCVTLMYVIQDVLLRMSVAMFALPAFALACMVGVIDGMVRRDLRRWGGGRESSFVYHHAKRYTHWAMTGGFSLYLAWPFGGFDPAVMVLVFTVLTAITLSTTVATFKKYV